ncbi:uncharacterized protein SOCE26_080720 [Sorangium cellulosum]|uniref:Mycofactocin system protein MftB n=1 Tax=Sorangium cellulosum TaxID=56 RepID=A0A2L0F4U5_SORCE|nr:uncharacterized protein SOCE26_080720 [Sorangium cellulosum]
MRPRVTLADHIVFRELPFCGVLLDTRDFHAYRLSRRAAEALRAALYGPGAASPHGSLIKDGEAGGPGLRDEVTRRLLESLTSRGMVRIVDEQPDYAGKA